MKLKMKSIFKMRLNLKHFFCGNVLIEMIIKIMNDLLDLFTFLAVIYSLVKQKSKLFWLETKPKLKAYVF